MADVTGSPINSILPQIPYELRWFWVALWVVTFVLLQISYRAFVSSLPWVAAAWMLWRDILVLFRLRKF